MNAARTGSREPGDARERAFALRVARSPLWWGVVFALWTVFGVLTTAHFFLRAGGTLSILNGLVTIVPFYWMWAPLTPVVLHITERLDFNSMPWQRAIAGHVGGALSITLVHGVLYGAVLGLLPRVYGGDLLDRVLGTLVRHGAGDVLTYAVVVGGYLAFLQYRRARDREFAASRSELRASRLEAQLSNARLEALKMQLHPHFFFNALNTVSTLVLKGEHRAAIRAIARIGELLRVTLAFAKTQELPLAEELALVERYLEIEQLRFGDRLRIETEIAPEMRRALVPSLILQPLIENAIRHGLRSLPAGGCICISAVRVSDAARLRVSDNGPGVPVAEGGQLREGIGLANTRNRLAELYGSRGFLRLECGEAGGTVATLEFPFRTEPAIPSKGERDLARGGQS
jgi:two-component system LytT family sensor kinase